MSSTKESKNPKGSRREFLKTSAIAGGAVATSLTAAHPVHAQGSDILKIGLIGCGGRGSGAAVNAMRAEDHLRLTAMAEAFADRL